MSNFEHLPLAKILDERRRRVDALHDATMIMCAALAEVEALHRYIRGPLPPYWAGIPSRFPLLQTEPLLDHVTAQIRAVLALCDKPPRSIPDGVEYENAELMRLPPPPPREQRDRFCEMCIHWERIDQPGRGIGLCKLLPFPPFEVDYDATCGSFRWHPCGPR